LTEEALGLSVAQQSEVGKSGLPRPTKQSPLRGVGQATLPDLQPLQRLGGTDVYLSA